MDSLAADVVYVSGRKRPAGEMNGKSGNINNVCLQLYPPGTVVPGNELICIFDADQVKLSQSIHHLAMPHVKMWRFLILSHDQSCLLPQFLRTCLSPWNHRQGLQCFVRP